MKTLIVLAEKGILPGLLIRMGIRRLNRKRLKGENRRDIEGQRFAMQQFIEDMKEAPIAISTDKANIQHYELPSSFFSKVLGKHMKYSGDFWKPGVDSLDQAETDMLALISERAQLEDNMDILELGCGWGSLTLWMATHYPRSRIVAVSNSNSQRKFIQDLCVKREISNVEVITRDMNDFSTNRHFDRIVSVEMFEHMRNWEQLLQRISNWLTPEGKLFIHIFTHKQFAYTFEPEGEDNWMGRFFFTGGMMPSDDLLLYFQKDLNLEAHWRVNGKHYQKTAKTWLKNLEIHRREIIPIMEEVYGSDNASIWFQRWRIFFMACEELWGYENGEQWLVSHYRLKKPRKEDKMEVKDYCSNVDMELTLWKAKIFDVIRKADQLGSAELEKVLPNIQDLKMVITDLEDRIHQLRTECPLEWKPIRDEIEGAKGNLTNTYDEVIDYIGGTAAPVDVPG